MNAAVRHRGPNLGFVREWFGHYWLGVWFGSITAIRASALVGGVPGFDGRLYLHATRAWLDGADPWIVVESQRFAAPPTTLVPLVPLAVLPEELGVAVLLVLGLAGAVATIRVLRLPWWWILFPPILDGVWNGNPQLLLVPLILVGAGPLAAFLKIYAIVPMVLTLRWRALAVTAVSLVVTAPFLPWPAYFAKFSELSGVLNTQSDGGLSATVIPWLIPIAAIALVFAGRERAAWLAVPVLWPATQWYYATLALPALTPLAAAAMAVPVPGMVVVAAVLVAIQRQNTSLPRLIADWRPADPRGRATGAG